MIATIKPFLSHKWGSLIIKVSMKPIDNILKSQDCKEQQDK
jgi:hypothetical protein